MIEQLSITGNSKKLINLEQILEEHPYARRNVKSLVKHCMVELYEPMHRLDKTRQQELVEAVAMIVSTLDRERRRLNQKDSQAKI